MISDYEIKQCMKAFKALLNKAPDCHEAHFGLGKLLASVGKFESALEHFKEASRIEVQDEIYKL